MHPILERLTAAAGQIQAASDLIRSSGAALLATPSVKTAAGEQVINLHKSARNLAAEVAQKIEELKGLPELGPLPEPAAKG